MDDRLQHLHGRLDEVDGATNRAHAAIEALPGTLDMPALHARLDELMGAMHGRFDEEMGRLHGRLDEVLARPAVDPTGHLDGLGTRIDQLGERVEGVDNRIRTVDESVRNNAGTLAGSIEQGVDKLHGALHDRPDRGELDRQLRVVQQESERRIVQQLDSVLAAFAEVVISRPKEAPAGRPHASRRRRRSSPRRPTRSKRLAAFRREARCARVGMTFPEDHAASSL